MEGKKQFNGYKAEDTFGKIETNDNCKLNGYATKWLYSLISDDVESLHY